MDEKDTIITKADIEVLRQIEPRKSILNFTAEEIAATGKWRTRFYDDLKEKSPYFRNENGDWREGEKTEINLIKVKDKSPNFKSVSEDIKSRTIKRGEFINTDTGWKISISRKGLEDTLTYGSHDKITLNALYEIDKILKSAILLDTNTSEYNKKNKSSNTLFMHKLYVPFEIDGKSCVAKLNVEEYADWNGNTQKRLYNLRGIKTTSFRTVSFTDKNQSHLRSLNDVTLSISDLLRIVKACDPKFYTNLRENSQEKTTTKKPLMEKLKIAKEKLAAQDKQPPEPPSHDKNKKR